MTITTLPTRGPTDLGEALSDVRAPEENELSAVNVERIKDRIIELASSVGLDDGSTAGSIREALLSIPAGSTETSAAFFDDFDQQELGWVVTNKTAGASIKRAGSLAAYGFPSFGTVLLEVDNTASAAVSIVRPAAAALDTGKTIVWEVCLSVLDSGLVGNDECQWSLGVSSADGESIVAVLCENGTAYFVTYQSGVPEGDSITLPAWTQRLRLRCTMSQTGAVLEAAADSGAFATIHTSTDDPDAATYSPFLTMEKSSFVGDRTLAVDYFRLDADRANDAVGSPVAEDVFTQPEYVDAAALADLETAINDVDSSLSVHTAASNPHSGSAATTYVDQPARRNVSGTTDTIVIGDVGGVVFYSQAGGVTASLPDLSASLRSGGCMVLTLQGTNVATVITVDPGSGVTIDGSTSNYVAATGRARVSLISVDGVNWFSGATP